MEELYGLYLLLAYESLTIQMKATEQHFSVVLCVMRYAVQGGSDCGWNPKA